MPSTRSRRPCSPNPWIRGACLGFLYIWLLFDVWFLYIRVRVSVEVVLLVCLVDSVWLFVVFVV